jgi:NADPH2:quinone reductase
MKMKAIGFKKSLPITDPESLVLFDKERPVARGHDVLVQVKAVSVNPVDYKVRNRIPSEETLKEHKIPGYDASGVIVESGEIVTLFNPGDEVFYAGSILRDGTDAEFHLVDERIVGRKPKKVSHEEAAAVPLTAITAWEAIFERLLIERGSGDDKSILIIGGAGGVGSMAIQLLKCLTKLKVITTASRDVTRKWCLDLGADLVVNHRNLEKDLKENEIEQVDYILNFVDTDAYWDAMCNLIKPLGRICSIVPAVGQVALGSLFEKSVSFSWELMFTKFSFQTPGMITQHELLNEVSDMLDQGSLRSTATKILKGFSVENFKKAHQQLESKTTIGKIVIRF